MIFFFIFQFTYIQPKNIAWTPPPPPLTEKWFNLHYFYPWSKVEPWVNRWTFSPPSPSPSPSPSPPPPSHHQIFVSLRYRKRRGGGGRMVPLLCLQSCLSKNPDFLEMRTLAAGFMAWRLALWATSVMLDRERIYSLSWIIMQRPVVMAL